MIVFDLECRAGGHRFEGWFGSSEDFAGQQQRGLVACPQCQSPDVGKAPMAARLTRKGNQAMVPVPASLPSAPAADALATVPQAGSGDGSQASPLPPEAAAMMQAMIRIQAQALRASSWVGEKFAVDARAMHYGDKDQASIHGQATLQEARDLLEEGIEIAPILFPFAAPGQVN